MAEIISSGRTQAASADFTLADGESVFITLEPPGRDQYVEIQVKNGANYRTIGTITDDESGARVLQAPGTFRVNRPEQARPFAVHKTP